MLTAAPRPAITPQPSRPATAGSADRVDLGALAFVHQRLVGERTDAQRGAQLGAVREGHLLVGVEGVEAVPRAAAFAGPALSAHGAPVENDEVADLHVGDTLADGFDGAGGLMAEQERVLVVDAALAVRQVGVTHPARDDVDHHLARTGIRDHNVDQLEQLSYSGRSHRALSDSWATT